MPFTPIPDCAQVVVNGANVGEPWTNVLHYSGEDTGLEVPETLAAIADMVHDAYDTLEGVMHTSWSVSEIIVTNLADEGGAQFSLGVNDVVGEQGTDPLPSQMALVVSYKTAVRTRRGRGRTYLCGWIADALNGQGNADAGPQAAASTWVDDLRSIEIGALTYELGVRSILDAVCRPVTSFSVDRRFDVIRRRNRDV